MRQDGQLPGPIGPQWEKDTEMKEKTRFCSRPETTVLPVYPYLSQTIFQNKEVKAARRTF